ncbi:helix-turn-helix domain-containing protein [Vibrio harveyi]|uniref:helix-turn-helix domain-containing protein n=1 Tax=Vibrio harveyi TaxID=669 RepID=UPI0012631A95|nr:helix-turn-helix domain-containing protein [Vibrio harveyi]QFQ76875.1 helix-turn-helix domain-containing protein [Vibrio harveyi]
MPKGKYYGGGAPKKYDDDKIMNLVNKGVPKVDICKMLGCGRSVIYKAIKKHNQGSAK